MKRKLYLCAVSFAACLPAWGWPSGVGTVGSGAMPGAGAMPALNPPSSNPVPAGPAGESQSPPPASDILQNNIPTNNAAPNILTNNTPMPGGSKTADETVKARPGPNQSGGVTNTMPGARHHWWQSH